MIFANTQSFAEETRNRSEKTGIGRMIVQRLNMMECFLGRLSHSSYRDSFVLKGGVLVGALFGATLRSTMDIDQTIKGIPLKNRKLN
jgi:hypothetical protein